MYAITNFRGTKSFLAATRTVLIHSAYCVGILLCLWLSLRVSSDSIVLSIIAFEIILLLAIWGTVVFTRSF